jgi:hypothetical protein
MTDDDPWDSIYDALRVQWEQAFKYALEHECGGDEHKAAIETLEEFIAFSVRQAMMDGDIKEEAVPPPAAGPSTQVHGRLQRRTPRGARSRASGVTADPAA